MKSYTPSPIDLGSTFRSGAVRDEFIWTVIGVYAQVVIAETTGGKRRNFSRSFVSYRLDTESQAGLTRAG